MLDVIEVGSHHLAAPLFQTQCLEAALAQIQSPHAPVGASRFFGFFRGFCLLGSLFFAVWRCAGSLGVSCLIGFILGQGGTPGAWWAQLPSRVGPLIFAIGVVGLPQPGPGSHQIRHHHHPTPNCLHRPVPQPNLIHPSQTHSQPYQSVRRSTVETIRNFGNLSPLTERVNGPNQLPDSARPSPTRLLKAETVMTT